jgi:hypothetical protein
MSVVLALGMATGLGLMVHLFVAGGEPDRIRLGFLIVFWVSFFFGIIMPLLVGAMNQGFDAAPFRVFPLSRRRLYAVTLAASLGGSDHMLYYPTMVAVALTGVLLPGVPVLAGVALIVLVPLFLVIWGHALALLLTSVMRTRRAREITGIVALLLLIGVSFVPAMFDDESGRLAGRLPELRVALRLVVDVGRFLPPTIAADGLAALHGEDGGARVTASLLALVAWNAAGIWIGYRVFVRHHVGERGGGSASARRGALPARRTDRRRSPFDRRPFSALPVQVRAVAAKDLHYLFRSVVGRLNLFMAPVLVLVIVLLVGRAIEEPVLGIDPEPLLLFGLLLYAVLFSNNFVNNAFAWEGDGVRSYFLCPASPRQVLLGKNLAVWLYNALLFATVILVYSVLAGVPGPATLSSAAFLFASALVVFTACGNLISILLPVRRDPSRINNQPSQAAILLSLLVLGVTVTLMGPLLSLPVLFGRPAAQPLLLGLFFAASVAGYAWSLGPAARLLAGRRERIAEALRSLR